MRKVVGVVLAAGRSTRMAPAHKLLERLGERSVLGTTLDRLGASSIDGIVVVVGHRGELVAEEAARSLGRATVVRAERYADGLAATLAAGIGALPAETDGALIVLGDMPLVGTGTIETLLGVFRASGARAPIVLPVHGGQRGNPVVWHRVHLPALVGLDGDSGGRSLLQAHAADIVPVATGDAGVLADIDTPAALAEARALVRAVGQ